MLSVAFSPMFDWGLLAGLGGVGLALLAFGLFRRARGLGWRTVVLATLLLALANPVLVEEERIGIPDVAAVVVDDSPSQKIGERPRQTEDALAAVRARLDAMDDLEYVIVHAGGAAAGGGAPEDGTRLFQAVGRALANVPHKRVAGTILITDGQVHDAPPPEAALPFGGPLHVLLTGRRGERDRRIAIENFAGYGLVGKDAEIRLRVDEPGAEGGAAPVQISVDGGPPRTLSAPIGRSTSISVRIDHAGPNIVQLQVAPAPDELTTANNRAVAEISGVRERLRVLLVSGEPHPGERVWRNFLKADPSVDLVHFTILRPPEKQDATPVRELSLIAFPIRELFEVKLDEFDLIIFDRYRRRGVLPGIYLENIVRYVENGGAVLEAAGPEFAGSLSLFRTPLGDILPAEPTGRVFEQGFKARLTEVGARHPVTADLPSADEAIPRWGRWFRQIDATTRGGLALMKGADDRPLLVVQRVQKGRVAQLLSDHIWLWARGFEDGGPHSELLRRLAHWLMKEPELEENDLRASAVGNELQIVRRSIEPDDSPVEVTSPSGKTQTVRLHEDFGGRSLASVPIEEIGIYKVADGHHTRLAAVGNLNPREFADMRATADVLAPLVKATHGGLYWLEDGVPELRRVRAGRATAGRSWAGLVANEDYRVASVREVPLLPALLALLLALGGLMLAWRREGR